MIDEKLTLFFKETLPIFHKHFQYFPLQSPIFMYQIPLRDLGFQNCVAYLAY